jgi:hypothetical protein
VRELGLASAQLETAREHYLADRWGDAESDAENARLRFLAVAGSGTSFPARASFSASRGGSNSNEPANPSGTARNSARPFSTATSSAPVATARRKSYSPTAASIESRQTRFLRSSTKPRPRVRAERSRCGSGGFTS